MNSGGLGGISLYMFGEDGNEYFYTHLQGYADETYVGRYVDAGDLVAYNGSTGNADASAPHLHFEVHPGGGSSRQPVPVGRGGMWSMMSLDRATHQRERAIAETQRGRSDTQG